MCSLQAFSCNVWEEWAEICHVHFYLVISPQMKRANFSIRINKDNFLKIKFNISLPGIIAIELIWILLKLIPPYQSVCCIAFEIISFVNKCEMKLNKDMLRVFAISFHCGECHTMMIVYWPAHCAGLLRSNFFTCWHPSHITIFFLL